MLKLSETKSSAVVISGAITANDSVVRDFPKTPKSERGETRTLWHSDTSSSTTTRTIMRRRLLFPFWGLSLCLCAAPVAAFQGLSIQNRLGLVTKAKFPLVPSSPPGRSLVRRNLSAPSSKTGGINGKSALSHSDIVWKIRSHPEQPWTKRSYFRFAAWFLHTYLRAMNRKIPSVVCPAGGLCQIEAWYQGKQVGRFGITTTPGPSMPLIAQQVSQIYRSNSNAPAALPTTAAIQYMVIEPDFRKQQIGALALQVIAYVHAFINCDFTLLVANDNGSGKLVDWYQRNGFCRAPLLQDLLGSPNEKYGVTMVGPTNATLPDNCRLEWW